MYFNKNCWVIKIKAFKSKNTKNMKNHTFLTFIESKIFIDYKNVESKIQISKIIKNFKWAPRKKNFEDIISKMFTPFTEDSSTLGHFWINNNNSLYILINK